MGEGGIAPGWVGQLVPAVSAVRRLAGPATCQVGWQVARRFNPSLLSDLSRLRARLATSGGEGGRLAGTAGHGRRPPGATGSGVREQSPYVLTDSFGDGGRTPGPPFADGTRKGRCGCPRRRHRLLTAARAAEPPFADGGTHQPSPGGATANSQGRSPWEATPVQYSLSPEGAAASVQGLAPLAIGCRPYGAGRGCQGRARRKHHLLTVA
jgi:hypothetical protein